MKYRRKGKETSIFQTSLHQILHQTLYMYLIEKLQRQECINIFTIQMRKRKLREIQLFV